MYIHTHMHTPTYIHRERARVQKEVVDGVRAHCSRGSYTIRCYTILYYNTIRYNA